MKDRKKSEGALLRRRQQVVAPLQCSAQGLMTWNRPAPAGQQRETILHRERICPTLRSLARAAASSIASGMPSRRRQMSRTMDALAWVIVKPG